MWAEHATEPTGIDDLVNYAFLVAPSIMLLKDGALLTAYYYQGPDLDYASPEEKAHLSAQVNAAGLRCGTGWMWHVDMTRQPAMGYMPQGAFTHPTLALIDEEARRRYCAKGHYENVHTLAITYLPPPEIEGQVKAWFVEGASEDGSGWEAVVESFSATMVEVEGILKGALRLNRMNDADLLTYLHTIVTGLDHPVRVPPIPIDLDSVIADQDLVTGWRPKMGNLHIRTLSIDGFPQMTEPGANSFLHEFPLDFRWSTRWIPMNREDAEKLTGTKRKHWWQQRHKFAKTLVESHSGEESPFQEENAVDMAKDAAAAKAEASSGEVLFGLYTSTLVVSGKSEKEVNYKRDVLQQHVQARGYNCRNEEVNAVEALIGSYPGHGDQNVSRIPIHTLNLADLLPMWGIWTGALTNPNPYFPKDSPPLLMASTTGQTPFRFHWHVSDVGHGAVLGPTRSGKSFWTLMSAAQHARTPGAQVFYIDKGYSSFVLAHAIGAPYYDIGVDETAFCPLAQIDTEAEREWAKGWIESLLLLQGLTVTPGQSNAIWRALTLLGESTSRTLTDFVATVQDIEIRDAMAHYCLGGGAGSLLDADQDSLHESQYTFFEMERLLNRGNKDLIPVLLYLFHRIDQRCQTGRPTLLVIDEAWVVLTSELFGEQLETWLRTMGKKNAAVILATQSLADIEKSKYRSVVLDSCQTKIFLPNAAARASSELYHTFGLSETQTAVLAGLTAKQHYLYDAVVDGMPRCRVLDLQAGPVTCATIGAGGREDIARARVLIAKYGEDFTYHWLIERGCVEEAKWWWQQRERMMETPTERQRRVDSAVWNGTTAHSLEGVSA